jgi:hypothetical protein
MPNDHNVYQVAVKYSKIAIKNINIFHSKAIQNLPKLWFLVENIPSGNPAPKLASGGEDFRIKKHSRVHGIVCKQGPLGSKDFFEIEKKFDS